MAGLTGMVVRFFGVHSRDHRIGWFIHTVTAMKPNHMMVLVLAWLLSIVACDTLGGQDAFVERSGLEIGAKRPGEVRVMTRNVAIGGDIDRVLAAPSMETVPLLVAQTWQEIVTNDFHVRAEALAQEVKAHGPDIIGLQEITTLKIQDPGDMVMGGTEPATVVVYDFLQILQGALEARGLDYVVVGVVADTEAEMPMLTSPDPTFADVRMIDYDAVLARAGVGFENVLAQNFAYDWSLPFGPGGLTVKRGYVAFDAQVGEASFRFVSTHLEPVAAPDLQPLQLAQALELLAVAGEGTAIVVGDLNTAPGDPAYELLTSSGLLDSWAVLPGEAPGLTCCFAPDLLPGRVPDLRYDLVLYRNGGSTQLAPARGVITGRDPIEGVGIYPSDHAGVTVTFATE
jgi:endonuclease/exonuclease/phosphatase family metal-dependent hydrolase